jgi:hypothetical protein
MPLAWGGVRGYEKKGGKVTSTLSHVIKYSPTSPISLFFRGQLPFASERVLEGCANPYFSGPNIPFESPSLAREGIFLALSTGNRHGIYRYISERGLPVAAE